MSPRSRSPQNDPAISAPGRRLPSLTGAPPTATAGTGQGRPRSERRDQRGFTLIELLVTLILIAILVSMVMVSAVPRSDRVFRQEADRIAQLLTLAREEAQIRSAPIRMQFDDTGYRFVVYRDRAWRVLDGDPYLRPRRWDEPTRMVVERADGDPALEFGRDLIEPPFIIRLFRDGQSLQIVANGLGSFELVAPR